jgi:hypothetical protein
MDMATEDRRQQPDGYADADVDNNLVISEVKSLMSGSSIPNSSGTSAAAAADSSCSITHNDEPTTPQDHRPAEDDIISDDIKLCKKGCSSPALIDDDDYDDNKDNNNNEFQSLCRQPSTRSIITATPTQSDDPCLPTDTFSFLIICPNLQSRAFFLATVVFSFQIAIYAVLAYDITNLSNPINPLKFPVNVETPVRIAEAFAIVVAIITQDDVRKAVNLLRDGYDQELLADAFPGATKGKWFLSIVLRAIEGFLGLLLTFLLIMQSSTVLDLLLNFLAMEFVSQLDDAVFVLTREGFLSRTLMNEAKTLSNTYYHASHRSTESRFASFVMAAYFIALLTFFAAWVIIWRHQTSGKYLCQHIFGQFGDEVVPMLGTFTGLFSRHTQSFGGRLSYRDGQDGGALLAYCLEQKRWTLSLTTDNVEPCTWIAASDESIDFDVLTTANSQWVVRDGITKGILPLSQHFLACHDHMHNYILCGQHGERIIGDKDKHKCKCNPGRYGLRCESSELCDRLEIDPPGDQGFVKTGGTNSTYFASTYYRLEGAETYNRPVYTSLLGNNQDYDVNLGGNEMLSNETDIDIILFTGVRWILTYKSLFPEMKDVNDVSELAGYFSKFHGHFTKYNVSYVSEPVYVNEEVYIGSQLVAEASPSDLGWQYSSASQSTFDQQLRPDLEKSSIETKFSCIEDSSGAKMPTADMKAPSSRIGLIVGVLAAVLVLMVVAFSAYRKNAIKKHAAEMEEAQFDETEEMDVEMDATHAAENKVDCQS